VSDLACNAAACGSITGWIVRPSLSRRNKLTGTVASGNAKCRSPAAEYESRLEFLLFGLQSAVIFLNIFFDLIGDPKKF
jgi:hypothetical protein